MGDAARYAQVVTGTGVDHLVADDEAIATREHEHPFLGISVDVALRRANNMSAIEDSEGPARRPAVDEDLDGVAARKPEKWCARTDVRRRVHGGFGVGSG